MKIRSLAAVSALVALGATPFAAHASGSDKAANACIQAFVETYVPKDRTVQVRSLSPVSGPLGAYVKRYTLELSARLDRSGAELVSARCVANANGKVLSLDSTDAQVSTTELARLK